MMMDKPTVEPLKETALRAQGDKMVTEQAPDTGVLKTAEMVGLGTGAVQRLKREMAAAA
jgi:hypothetical protein